MGQLGPRPARASQSARLPHPGPRSRRGRSRSHGARGRRVVLRPRRASLRRSQPLSRTTHDCTPGADATEAAALPEFSRARQGGRAVLAPGVPRSSAPRSTHPPLQCTISCLAPTRLTPGTDATQRRGAHLTEAAPVRELSRSRQGGRAVLAPGVPRSSAPRSSDLPQQCTISRLAPT